MQPSEHAPDTPARCPLCETFISEASRAWDHCDACGGLLVHPADDAVPPGVTRRTTAAAVDNDPRDPYREPAAEPRLDIGVDYRHQRFEIAAGSGALFLVGVVTRGELPAAMLAGIVALAIGGVAWSLIPRTAVMRFIVTPDGLTVVGDGVPLHRGQRFAADDVERVFVRALARAERPEDRRLELALLDRHGRHHTLLRGLDDARALSWISRHLERALGFEAAR